jgi:hypothetical protein
MKPPLTSSQCRDLRMHGAIPLRHYRMSRCDTYTISKVKSPLFLTLKYIKAMKRVLKMRSVNSQYHIILGN